MVTMLQIRVREQTSRDGLARGLRYLYHKVEQKNRAIPSL